MIHEIRITLSLGPGHSLQQTLIAVGIKPVNNTSLSPTCYTSFPFNERTLGSRGDKQVCDRGEAGTCIHSCIHQKRRCMSMDSRDASIGDWSWRMEDVVVWPLDLYGVSWHVTLTGLFMRGDFFLATAWLVTVWFLLVCIYLSQFLEKACIKIHTSVALVNEFSII